MLTCVFFQSCFLICSFGSTSWGNHKIASTKIFLENTSWVECFVVTLNFSASVPSNLWSCTSNGVTSFFDVFLQISFNSPVLLYFRLYIYLWIESEIWNMIILDIKGWLYFRLDLSPYLMFVNPVSGKLSPTVFTWDQIWERESLVLFHSVVIWASDFRWNFVDLLCELGGGLVNSCWEGRRSLGHKFRISNVYKILKCPTGSWHGMTRFPTDFEDWYGV